MLKNYKHLTLSLFNTAVSISYFIQHNKKRWIYNHKICEYIKMCNKAVVSSYGIRPLRNRADWIKPRKIFSQDSQLNYRDFSQGAYFLKSSLEYVQFHTYRFTSKPARFYSECILRLCRWDSKKRWQNAEEGRCRAARTVARHRYWPKMFGMTLVYLP
jgi:hypothetical protein